MSLIDCKELNRRLAIIKKVCETYRKELTVSSAMIMEMLLGYSKEDYIEFMNGLSLDEFQGTYLTALYVDESINTYEKALETGSFDTIVECAPAGVISIEEFHEELAKYEEEA